MTDLKRKCNDVDSQEEESTKLLLSTVAHLLGFDERADGKLEIADVDHSTRRRDTVDIENVNTEYAKHWKPGALLDAVADLNIIPDSEISTIKEELNIGKVSTSQFSSSLPVQGQSSSPQLPPPQTENSFKQPPAPGLKNQRFYPPRVTPAPKVNPPESAAPSNNFNSSTTSGPFQFKRPAPIQDSSSKPTSLYGSLQPSSSKKFASNGGQPQNQNSFFHTAEEQNNPKPVQSGFRTGLDQLKIDDKKKGIHRNYNVDSNAGTGRRVGLSRPANSNGTAPRKPRPTDDEEPESDNPELDEIMAHESMKNISRKMVETVLNEVVQITSTDWDDIAGLEQVKKTIWEIIIWPMMRPDLFSGLRSAPKGILFFGPPGTGKTMFGRMIATKSESMFFNISASSLTSKWIGEGEKMVRALFAVARLKQPSVIFIDEIDSILTQRSDTEHESSRRLKTEFLIQFDGCATQNEDRILVIGVTNRPQELDEAARRRLAKRVYIPLPDEIGRKQIIKNLMSKFDVDMTEEDFDLITEKSNGYSGADVTNLCKEASYGPLRDIPPDQLQNISVSQVRPIQTKDFLNALKNVKSSVAEADIEIYEDWNSKFGCHS